MPLEIRLSAFLGVHIDEMIEEGVRLIEGENDEVKLSNLVFLKIFVSVCDGVYICCN